MIKLYHYTDDERAGKIIRSGRVMASLKTSGDAVFGNGVYLTQLKPGSSSRAQVAKNNWLNTSDHSLKKTKNVFVLEIPEDEVKNVSTTTRDIFLLGGRKDLLLVKYKWYLKDFDTGKIRASYKYHIGSTGPAASLSNAPLIMGDYVMTEETVNGRPVYQRPGYNNFLFMSSYGNWLVGPNTDKDEGWLKQKSKYSLGPSAEGPWDYGIYDADGKGSTSWKGDDATLKAYPSYMSSQWKTDFHSDSSIDPGSTKPAGTPSTSPATRDKMAASNPASADATTASTISSTLATTAINTPTAITPASATNATTPPPPPPVQSKSRPTSSNKSKPTSSNKSRLTSSNKSRPTSSNMPDPDRIDNGLQSPGTTRTGRVYGGSHGKTKGLRRRFVSMFQRLGKKQKGK